jgi:predicted DNA-binding transcriptional regulator AlpA
MKGLVSSGFFCEHCTRETQFLPIHFVVALIGVSRSTIYYWMDHGWIHWRELPSGRRIICRESLSRQNCEHPPFRAKAVNSANRAHETV